MDKPVVDQTSIKEDEYHPAANSAMRYVKSILSSPDGMMRREAIASTVLSGNRLAEICYGTIDRLDQGAPVSDRYILGLAWMLKEVEEHTDDRDN